MPSDGACATSVGHDQRSERLRPFPSAQADRRDHHPATPCSTPNKRWARCEPGPEPGRDHRHEPRVVVSVEVTLSITRSSPMRWHASVTTPLPTRCSAEPRAHRQPAADQGQSLPTFETTVQTPLTTAPAPAGRATGGGRYCVPASARARRPGTAPRGRRGLIGISATRDVRGDAVRQQTPVSLEGRPVIVIDPMLATGGSLVHTLQLLADTVPAADHAVCAVRGGHRAPRWMRDRRTRGDRGDRRSPQRQRLHRAGPGRRRRPPVRYPGHRPRRLTPNPDVGRPAHHVCRSGRLRRRQSDAVSVQAALAVA